MLTSIVAMRPPAVHFRGAVARADRFSGFENLPHAVLWIVQRDEPAHAMSKDVVRAAKERKGATQPSAQRAILKMRIT